MALSDEELDRYARHIVLPQVGGAGQQRLKAARIAVVGAGGVAGGVLPALAGAGIGHLTLIDNDRVELSNLQRQPLYESDQLGERKVDLAARFVGVARDSDSRMDFTRNDRVVAQGALTWRPTERTDITAIGIYQQDHNPPKKHGNIPL